MEIISKLFPDMLTVMTTVEMKGVSPENSTKLLNLLLDPLLSRKLKIQLAAYVEGLYPLRNLCYYLEADWSDLTFLVGGAGERVSEYVSWGQYDETSVHRETYHGGKFDF